MRVIYGTEVNTVVSDTLEPKDILVALAETYRELANGEYTVTTEGDERVMRVTLKAGNKAA